MGSERVPEKGPGEYQKDGIRVSTENVGFGQVPEKWDPGKYREGKIWVSTEKCRIRASTGNVGSGRVRKMWDPGEYRKGGIRARC